jgi:hypothetical protein
MTERSAEQAPVQTRPDTHDDTDDTARIPLAERLQRRLSSAGEQRNGSASSRTVGRVLPPPPPEMAAEKARAEEKARADKAKADERARAEAARRAEQENRAAVHAQTEAPPREAPLVPAPSPTTTQAPVTAPPAPTSRARRSRAPQAPSRVPRRARLRLSRVDPWSVMKVAFLLSIALGIVTVVSVFMVWSVLGAAGVWTSINKTVSDTVSSGSTTSTFNIENYLGMSRVLGFTMLTSVIDVVLITAIATLGAFLYNMAASLLGGIEVTLSEDQG